MQLIDEQNDVAVLLHFVDGGLDTLFKIATVLRTRDHTGKIKSHQTLAFQQLRHLAFMNLQRQAFRNGGLADARFTDEHRIILRTTRQDLNDTFNLVMTADDRVNLAFGCELCQVAAKLFKCTAAFLFAVFVLRVRVAGSFIDGITVGKRRGQRICNALRVNAEHLQETHRKAFTVFNDGNEQVLRADVVTAEFGGRELCHLQNALCARGEICGGEVRRRRSANLLLHQALVIVCRDAEFIQHVERNAAALCNQAVEHVLTADVIVAKFLRLFDGAVHGIVCFLCKTCESIHINSRPFDHCRIAVLFTDFLLLKRFEGFAHLVCAENVSLPRRKVAAVCGCHGGRLYRYGQCVNIFKRYTA